jgi:hypothetical protein
MTQLLEQALERLARAADLPESEQERIAADVLAVLGEKPGDRAPFPVERRVAGLGEGTVRMADDFDAPLPDAFWLGGA